MWFPSICLSHVPTSHTMFIVLVVSKGQGQGNVLRKLPASIWFCWLKPVLTSYFLGRNACMSSSVFRVRRMMQHRVKTPQSQISCIIICWSPLPLALLTHLSLGGLPRLTGQDTVWQYVLYGDMPCCLPTIHTPRGHSSHSPWTGPPHLKEGRWSSKQGGRLSEGHTLLPSWQKHWLCLGSTSLQTMPLH